MTLPSSESPSQAEKTAFRPSKKTVTPEHLAKMQAGRARAAAERTANPPPPRPSMRSAVDAKCRECIHDPIAGTGTWRQQVENCTSLSCPLYPVRPISKPRKTPE